jgi:hypothetical protein
VGEWERQVGLFRITLRIEPDHAVCTVTGMEGGKSVTYTLHADYSVTRDSVLYGVLTSLDASVAGGEKMEDLTNSLAGLHELCDAPFSLRIRQDEDLLTLKQLKCGLAKYNDADKKELGLLLGTYKRKQAECEADRRLDPPLRPRP